MKVKKLAILALLSSGMFFASAQLAMAESVKTCPDGTNAIYDENGELTGCEAPEVVGEETDPILEVDPTDGSCWSNTDGVNVCARGGVLMNTEDTPDPTPTDSGCTTTTDDQGLESIMCTDVVAYNMAPEDGTLMNKSDGIQVLSGQQVVSSPESRMLALSGIMVALAGGVALAVSANLKKK